jgi:methionyl aminopeptidase
MSDPASRIILKTPQDIAGMKLAGKLAVETLNLAEKLIAPGSSTLELNNQCAAFIKSRGGFSATLGYKGASATPFPGAICTSINDVVCHGIPSAKTILKNADLINIDVTVILGGYYGDTSKTYGVGTISESAALLIERTRKSLELGIAAVKPGANLNEIGIAIEAYLKPFGYGIVRALGGHGVGKHFHEGPFVPHHKQSFKGPKLKSGMTFTIEPMVNEGNFDVFVDRDDGWTIFTKDGSLSAQFEHTIHVTETGVEILTPWE